MEALGRGNLGSLKLRQRPHGAELETPETTPFKVNPRKLEHGFRRIGARIPYTLPTFWLLLYLEGQGLSKLVISGVIIRATPCRALITLLITYLLSPLPLQVVPLKAAFTEPGQEPRLQNLLNNRNIVITNNKKNKNR